MLKRINAALYVGNRGEQSELFVIAQGNGGAETATFEYNNAVLPPHPVQGHPGCSFTLDPGVHQFECIVVFNPGSPAARYDLFQVDEGGGLAPLNANVRSDQSSPLIGFTINGATVAAPAFAAAGARAMSPRAAKGKEKPAKKAAPKKAAAKKGKAAKKRAAKKPVRRTKKAPAAGRKSAPKRKGRR